MNQPPNADFAKDYAYLATENSRLRQEVDDLHNAVNIALAALGVDPGDWSDGEVGVIAAVASNLRVAWGQIKTRDDWGDVRENTITDALFTLVETINAVLAHCRFEYTEHINGSPYFRVELSMGSTTYVYVADIEEDEHASAGAENSPFMAALANLYLLLNPKDSEDAST